MKIMKLSNCRANWRSLKMINPAQMPIPIIKKKDRPQTVGHGDSTIGIGDRRMETEHGREMGQQ